MRIFISITIMLAAVTALVSSANAEISLPADRSAGLTIVNVDQAALFHKQRQELVVQATIRFEQYPLAIDRFAFIIPVPAQPSSVTFESPDLMRDLRIFDRRIRREQLTVIEGDYMHTTIVRKPSDPPPTQLLNDWLTSHGFAKVNPETFRFYDENNWQFVVLRVYPKSAAQTALLRPLRISFPTKQIVFPIQRFIEDGPTASIFLMTKNNLDITPLEKMGFDLRGDRAQRLRLKALPGQAELLVEDLGDKHDVFKEFRRGHMHFFSATADFSTLSVPDEVVYLPGPYHTPIGMIQNILAAGAAIGIVMLMNRRKPKSDDD